MVEKMPVLLRAHTKIAKPQETDLHEDSDATA